MLGPGAILIVQRSIHPPLRREIGAQLKDLLGRGAGLVHPAHIGEGGGVDHGNPAALGPHATSGRGFFFDDQKFRLTRRPDPRELGKTQAAAAYPAQENRLKVRLLLAFDWVDKRIVAAQRITKATLRKHYFVSLQQRDEARGALDT